MASHKCLFFAAPPSKHEQSQNNNDKKHAKKTEVGSLEPNRWLGVTGWCPMSSREPWLQIQAQAIHSSMAIASEAPGKTCKLLRTAVGETFCVTYATQQGGRQEAIANVAARCGCTLAYKGACHGQIAIQTTNSGVTTSSPSGNPKLMVWIGCLWGFEPCVLVGA